MADNLQSEAGPSLSKTTKSSKRSGEAPRKRVSQACDRCRARKDKCDGQKPICSTCASQDAVCNYDSNTKKRGLPEGYVRGLEKLWGLSIREVDDIEESVITALSNESIAETWNDVSNESETLQDTWRNSRISKELERLLPLLDIEDKPSAKRKREVPRTESMSGVRPALRTSVMPQGDSVPTVVQNYPGNNARPSNVIGKDSTLTQALDMDISLSSNPRNGNIHTIPKSQMQLPARTFQLIDIYFSYTHSWFPILEKYDIVRFSHQYTTAILDLSPSSTPSKPSASGNNAVLWALLAYTDSQRRSLQLDQQTPEPEKIYQYARSLIPNEEGILDIGHVQALLLLTLYSIGQGRWSAAWSLIGQTARHAIELGFGDLRIPTSKRSQHVFLGCFVLDTLIAARLKRSPQLRREEIRDIRLEEDGLEEWDPAPDCLSIYKQDSRGPAGILSTFNSLVNVLSILNSSICDTSSGNLQKLTIEMEALDQLPKQFAPAGSGKTLDVYQFILPHHCQLYAAYVTVSTSLSLEASHQSIRSPQEVATSTLAQINAILNHHSQHFGFQILPPTYDYYMTIVNQCATIDQNLGNAHRIEIQQLLSTMVKTWPTYSGINICPRTDNIDQARDIANHSRQFQRPDVPRDALPRAHSSAVPLSSEGRHVANSTAFDVTAEVNDRRSTSMSVFNASDQDMLSRFGKSPSINLSTIQTGVSPNVPYMPQTPLGTASWSTTTPGAAQDAFPFALQSNQAFETASSSLDIDGDSMFNEFAALDAMEWTNNWDQSLLNLGFTDPTSMNQDFYAFCREPDPLYPNGLVQQLLSSNMNLGNMGSFEHNAANNGSTANGSITGPAMALPNSFARMEDDFSSPHVEASQILQRLAAGQEGLNKRR